MSGKIVLNVEVHECSRPRNTRPYGIGSVWECDCGNLFLLKGRDGTYGWQYDKYWEEIPSYMWDAENKRVLNPIEIAIKTMESNPDRVWYRFWS